MTEEMETETETETAIGLSEEEKANRFGQFQKFWTDRQAKKKHKQERSRAWTDEINSIQERITEAISMKVPQDDEGRAQRFLTVQSLYQDKEEAEAGKKAEMHELKSAIEDIDEAIQKLVDGGEQLGLFGEDEDEEAYQEEAARRKAEVLADAQFKVNEAVEVYYEDEWYPAKVSDVSAKEMADDGVEIEYQVSFSRSVSENLNLEELRQVSEEEIREIPKPAGRGKSKKNAKKKTSKRKTKKTTKA